MKNLFLRNTSGGCFWKFQPLLIRNSRPEAFCWKGILRNFAKFTGNICARVSFLVQLQAGGPRPSTSSQLGPRPLCPIREKLIAKITIVINYFHKTNLLDKTDQHICFRSSRPEVFCKKAVLEISRNSHENTCVRVSFLILLQAKKRLWHRCFPVNFTKFLRTPILTEHLWWPLLMFDWILNIPGFWICLNNS